MPLTAGQKIHLAREALKALSDKQPTTNNVWTWAVEGHQDLPAIALQDLAQAFIDRIGGDPT